MMYFRYGEKPSPDVDMATTYIVDCMEQLFLQTGMPNVARFHEEQQPCPHCGHQWFAWQGDSDGGCIVFINQCLACGASWEEEL